MQNGFPHADIAKIEKDPYRYQSNSFHWKASQDLDNRLNGYLYYHHIHKREKSKEYLDYSCYINNVYQKWR